MPREKKAQSIKASVKVANSLSKKASLPNKQEDASLHQNFIKSLDKLEAFWQKNTATLKKQVSQIQIKITASRQKQPKTTAAKSVNKKQIEKNSAKLSALQEELAVASNKLTLAKKYAKKYADLSKMITQFERQWLKELASSAFPSLKTSAKNTPEPLKQPKEETITPSSLNENLRAPSSALATLALLDEVLKAEREENYDELWLNDQEDSTELAMLDSDPTDLYEEEE